VKRWRWPLAALLALAAAASIYAYAWVPRHEGPSYVTARVEEGPIRSVVLATGTLTPRNTVTVGSEISGRVAAVYADFNEPVEEGQLLARLDPRTFQERVGQARAEVEVSAAGIAQREAEFERAAAERRLAERNLARRKALGSPGHVSASELDADETTLAIADAHLRVAEAAIANARAAHAQRLATLRVAELDLERTAIRSPVGGHVIRRNVDAGQTVAASLQAPELFRIAEDLRRMRLEASVDEADVGRIAVGMPSRFTVDAFPDRTFEGRIEQIRHAPETLYNVVVYKVIIDADNADLALLPGMTAHVAIETGFRERALKVPNAALRFEPPAAMPVAMSVEAASSAGAPPGRHLWRLHRGELERVAVTVGLSDGGYSEIVDGVGAGDRVVLRARPRDGRAP
jgi:HlyD family secretion protein